MSNASYTAMKISPLAGKPAEPAMLVNVPKLVTAYYTEIPDPAVSGQRVAFGTSGHRGSALDKSFNEWHILAISQAICLYRKQQEIAGPLYLGMDTHALSAPALASALEVLKDGMIPALLAAEITAQIGRDPGEIYQELTREFGEPLYDRVEAESGWFAARPSGTEDIYKIYAESFRGENHLHRILEEAQSIVNDALAASARQPGSLFEPNLKGKL